MTTILLAMVAMAFTAISYGRMAQAYPSAGSAFTYVTRECSPLLGYVTGWAMLMDYVLNPLISIIWCSRAAMNFAPQVPYAVWAVAFFALFTTVNLVGIKSSARISGALAAITGAVVFVFIVCAGWYVWHHGHGSARFFTRPFYDPRTFHAGAGLIAAALARYYVRNPQRRWRDLWPAAAGFLTCLLLWISLSHAAKIVGASRMAVGVVVGAVRTRGFRQGVLRFEAPSDE